MKIIKNGKKVANDIIINLLATVVPVLLLQFIMFPIIALKYDSKQYGLMLTIIGLVTLLTQAFSVSLGNSRMLLNQEYERDNIEGDFNILLAVSSAINIVLLLLGIIYYGEFNFLSILFILIIAFLQLIRKYFIVYFRIKINYKNVLYSNVYLIVGYILGLIAFLVTYKWELILLMGELVSLLYIIRHSKFHTEAFVITKKFRETAKHSVILFMASLLGTANTYLDRLFLFPLLGPHAVSVYYVSSLFGKTMSLGVAPMSNVLLSYLIRLKKLGIGSFLMAVLLSMVLGVASYFIIMLVSEPLLSLLYPSYVKEALDIIKITTLTAIVTMMTSLINPMVMRYKSVNWQVWINFLNIIVFILMSIAFINRWGLLGFCYAALVSAFVKWILTILIFITQKSNI